MSWHLSNVWHVKCSLFWCHVAHIFESLYTVQVKCHMRDKCHAQNCSFVVVAEFCYFFFSNVKTALSFRKFQFLQLWKLLFYWGIFSFFLQQWKLLFIAECCKFSSTGKTAFIAEFCKFFFQLWKLLFHGGILSLFLQQWKLLFLWGILQVFVRLRKLLFHCWML